MTLKSQVVIGLLVALVVVGCTGGGGDEELAGSFGLCSSQPPPEGVEQSELVLDAVSASPGGEIGVTWAPVDPEALWGPDLVVECWAGDEWVSVWITREWVRVRAESELVIPGEETMSNDEGIFPGSGTLTIPVEAPPGVYRIGGDRFEARFEVDDSEPIAQPDVGPEIEVELIGEQVGDSFCVRRTCWPLFDSSVAVGLTRVKGTLSLRGLDLFASVPPFPDDGRVIDSNATENVLQQWLASQGIDVWVTEGAGDGRARVFFEVADQDLLEAVEAEFGDRVGVDAATLIPNASIDDYEALHTELGTSPEPEPRLVCAGEIRAFDLDLLGSADVNDSCRLAAYNHNSARVAISMAPPPESTTVTVLAQEIDCASARTPAPEDVVVLVDETDERIAVGILLVQPEAGEANCPDNPTIQVQVELAGPVGDRAFVSYLDGSPLGVGQQAIDNG